MADPFLISAVAEVHERGIVGACLLRDDFLVANHFPRSDTTAQSLCDVIDAMCRGYDSVGRRVNEYYFGYDGGVLAVFALGAWRLAILGESAEDPEPVVRAGRRFFENHADLVARLAEAPRNEPV